MKKVYLAFLLTTSMLAQAMDSDESKKESSPPSLSTLDSFKQRMANRPKPKKPAQSEVLMATIEDKAEELRQAMTHYEETADQFSQKATSAEEKTVHVEKKALELLEITLQLENLKKMRHEALEEAKRNQESLMLLEGKLRELQKQKTLDEEDKKKHLELISTLESEKSKLTQLVEFQAGEINRLKKIIEELEARLHQLGAKFDKLAEENSNLSQKLSLQSREMEDYKHQALALREEKSQASEKLDLLEKQLTQKSLELQEALLNQQTHQEERSRLEKEKKRLEGNLEEARGLSQELERQKKTLEKQLEGKEKDNEALIKKIKELIIAQQELHLKMQEASKFLELAEQEKGKLREEVEEMKRQNAELRDELKRMAEAYQKLQAEREEEIRQHARANLSNYFVSPLLIRYQVIFLIAENTKLKAEMEKLRRENILLKTNMLLYGNFFRVYHSQQPKPSVPSSLGWLSWAWQTFCVQPYNVIAKTCSIAFSSNHVLPYGQWNNPTMRSWDWDWQRQQRSMELWKHKQKRLQQSAKIRELPDNPAPSSVQAQPVLPTQPTPHHQAMVPAQRGESVPPFWNSDFDIFHQSEVWHQPSAQVRQTNRSLSDTMKSIKDKYWPWK